MLYKWVTIAGAHFMDVRSFQLEMMYVAYLLFIITIGRIGWLLGGAFLSFAVVALSMTAWIFIGLGFIGGAPRMYAYPLIAFILYALLRDRPYLLAAVTVLGALLYPIVATIGGSCLAGWLLLGRLSQKGTVGRWTWSRRLVTLGLTGFLTIASMLPLIMGSRAYGRRVVESDIVMYPEAGPDGGYLPHDRLPYKLFGFEWMAYFFGPMYSHGDPIASRLNVHKNFDRTTALFVMSMTGLIAVIIMRRAMKSLLAQDESGLAGRLMSFFGTCVALHVVAWIASPYLFIPNRYFMFSLPFVVTLLFPWSLQTVIRSSTNLKLPAAFHSSLFLGIISLYLVAFGGRGNVDFSGFSVEPRSQPLFAKVASLPKEAMIAAWPIGEGQKLEYVARRNVFLTLDIHHLFYIEFLQTMRRRMDAIFDAYFSTEATPLYRLRDQFGVTHLIVETRDFTDAKHPPEYFAPWRSRIGPRLAAIKGKEYLLNEALQKRAAIFNQNGFVLLDLKKLP
jgi:hypothetical protein